jgi:hypothetical protein
MGTFGSSNVMRQPASTYDLDVAERPELTAAMSAAEFQRWYWLKAELTAFTRSLQLPTSGSKPELASRIARHLDARPMRPQTRRATVSRTLPEPLTLHTAIGPHQAATRQLRSFFEATIGTRFTYDIHMRTFLASATTKTLGEAVDHWHATRKAPKPETLPQLEFVRFSKRWYRANPTGTPSGCRVAWKHERSLPAEQRTLPPLRLK